MSRLGDLFSRKVDFSKKKLFLNVSYQEISVQQFKFMVPQNSYSSTTVKMLITGCLYRSFDA